MIKVNGECNLLVSRSGTSAYRTHTFCVGRPPLVILNMAGGPKSPTADLALV
jgi:hypothetical protein